MLKPCWLLGEGLDGELACLAIFGVVDGEGAQQDALDLGEHRGAGLDVIAAAQGSLPQLFAQDR